jgi:hypothetical protein
MTLKGLPSEVAKRMTFEEQLIRTTWTKGSTTPKHTFLVPHRRIFWGPSSSEGPQKHDLTMSSKCDIHEQVPSDSDQNHSVRSTNNTKVDAAPKLRVRKLRHDSRKGNRLKGEKAI